ncbi:class I SAM-dependent methyltransferase [Mycobacterium ostraviense]|uniref:6-O-methylguanine DNA methyltransferase n=1 Tax=Mycobacterium ostraviense TaxID=2738409 RepID=A0A163TI51_9MYCO|nr:class I SAM-dependent methyltransferase [Mycobacterium ostraviense]KZS55309.1 6-O-methylguanine DNA methyltransferase [Mycobacterium ostraviense]UGT91042.1 class I SAM-dependent methyltransferase [Mycobacterium ostraviense]
MFFAGQPELAVEQREHWQATYRAHPAMYGSGPSLPARYALEVFQTAGANRVLELAAGQGRDSLHFARAGLQVLATDFSDIAVAQLRRTARTQGLGGRVRALVHDLREPLPVETGSVDAVFAHMALCMALSTKEIHAIVDEVRRVLKPGGKFVYTVRHTGDGHYGMGQCHGDDIFECGGFAVHFFSRELVASLAADWILDGVHAFEEGELPRRLWRVTVAKPK